MNSAEKGADLVSIDCMVLYAVLNHYQTTNFRLFQTKKVCKQFQILRKWQKVIQTGRKHCGKRGNCSLRAISTFPTVFSKGLFPRGAKMCHCVGILDGILQNYFPKRQILDSSKLKESGDVIIKFDEYDRKFSKWIEKTLWEKEKLLSVF